MKPSGCGTMVQKNSGLFLGLLGFVCVLQLCVSEAPQICGSLKTVRSNLNSTLRRHYMKTNFPINYTVRVRYEEVFRLRNISRLSEDEQVTITDLRKLWLYITKKGIQKILKVLPERHPTRRKYLSSLEQLFLHFEGLFYPNVKKDDESETPDSLLQIWDRLEDRSYQGWKPVTPKSILDNSYRTMRCLFRECFTEEDGTVDYCEVLYWRKGNKTTAPPMR